MGPLARVVWSAHEEWGYFVLSELSEARGPLGLPIERDLYFKPGPFSEACPFGKRACGRVVGENCFGRDPFALR